MPPAYAEGMRAAPDAGIGARVAAWFAAGHRPLPWRAPGFPAWGVLVSEFMLQQTPVTRVIPRLEEWLARWPTPTDLAAVPPGDAVRAWDRLGYPRRALNLHAASVAIAERHGGVVPSEVDALLALPGVGPYTARAVAGFAYGGRARCAGCSREPCGGWASRDPRGCRRSSPSWSRCCRRIRIARGSPTPA